MAKRKSKSTAEFKPPQRTQTRAKRQKNTEETNSQTVDDDQTPKSENNSHNASCSDKLDGPRPEQSTLQVIPTTEFPVVRCCSLEEQTCSDDNEEHGNKMNPPDVSHETDEATVQTPDLDNKECALSKPVDIKVERVDQPDVELDDNHSEIINDYLKIRLQNLKTTPIMHQAQTDKDSDQKTEIPSDKRQIERELSYEDNRASEPTSEQLESSEDISESSVDQMGIQNEDADPVVRRKVKKRMGMCRLGERRRMLMGQVTRGNENEVGRVLKLEPVIMCDDFKKNRSIFPDDEGNTEMEISAPSFPASSTLEKTPIRDEEQTDGDDFHAQISRKQEITHEIHNKTLSCVNADDIKLLETNETECMEQNAFEHSIREDKSLLYSETEIITKMRPDFVEEFTDVSAEIPKETTEPSTSTKPLEELLKARGSDIEQSGSSEHHLNASVSVEPTETINTLPVIHKREDESESSFGAVNTVNHEDDIMWSLSSSAAPPCGEDRDMQSAADHNVCEAPLSPAVLPEPSSPFSIHSVTDSQLNNIPLSLEDFPLSEVSCDLEDATELVCDLTRAIVSLNQRVMDARRQIGFVQQGRKPPRPLRHCSYGPAHSAI